MMKQYKKEIIICSILILLCVVSFLCVKNLFFSTERIDKPIKDLFDDSNKESIYKEANTIPIKNNYEIITGYHSNGDDLDIIDVNNMEYQYPYEIAPTFTDDGSIIYDGLTLTELTNKLNKSLNHYLTNTGYFFANYTKRTGLNPYLAVSIVLLESGCKWGCSRLTVNCNNIGGLKGGNSCNGGSYRKYNTLGEGIDGFLDIIYKNYYLKGLTTPEQMAPYYAQSSTWAEKVNNYINEVKAK